ncbi:MAG TPA: ribosome small subunit-dependent GTPase A [Steroidobacteraceae bacterium]|nr:ribosome small subunit-dependent GTPase A [Steroidobacteraceae bacterium]
MNDTFEARVTATFGRHLLVRDASGKELEARPFGRGLNVVCGDNVRCRPDPHHDEIHVVEIIQRRTALYRSNVRGATEPVIANLSRLMVVLAPVPVPDLFVVDRYLSAAESGGIAGLLVVNKIELGINDELAAQLDVFTAAGYRWFPCSVKTGEGIEALLEVCAGQVAALVGQSGVGKSSLVDRLIPGAGVEVGDLVREEEGRHTTTASRMFDLPLSGNLIDSPGVRDFAPAVDRLDSRSLGFVEVERLAPQCRFSDCRHMREPGCAVQNATESGGMSPRRYESYRRLRRLYEELTAARGPERRR